MNFRPSWFAFAVSCAFMSNQVLATGNNCVEKNVNFVGGIATCTDGSTFQSLLGIDVRVAIQSYEQDGYLLEFEYDVGCLLDGSVSIGKHYPTELTNTISVNWSPLSTVGCLKKILISRIDGAPFLLVGLELTANTAIDLKPLVSVVDDFGTSFCLPHKGAVLNLLGSSLVYSSLYVNAELPFVDATVQYEIGNDPGSTALALGFSSLTFLTCSEEEPAVTIAPTKAPTAAPTTKAPTKAPTTAPTTKAPTKAPTTAPTTKAPTKAPTAAPTTKAPTKVPTTAPTTKAPTKAPTAAPTTKAPITKAPVSSPPTAKPTAPDCRDHPCDNQQNGNKVNICHRNTANNWETICISQSSLYTHIGQHVDDLCGTCEFNGKA